MNAFEVSRMISNNLARGQEKAEEQHAIDRILSQSGQGGDLTPDLMSQLLSRVNPERAKPIMDMLNQRREGAERDKRLNLITGAPQNAPAGNQPQNVAGLPVNQPEGTVDFNEAGVTETPKGLQAFDDNQLIALTGEKGFAEPAKQELKRRQEDRTLRQRKEESGQKETLDIRKKYFEKGEAARKGIENKKQLFELVEKGNLDDPTFAVIAENLPYNLGKRMLSNDTVTYKAGLVDEFSDLRNIFEGQTRVKEIDLLENKLADTYLNDSQKKAILKSRINALQADVIKEEAAQEVEEKYPGIPLLQFQKKVNQTAKPKLEALLSKILLEQKNIFAEAEEIKKSPLNPKDPEGYKIMSEIMEEAGGDKGKAKTIAKKKGYSW